MSGGKDKRMPEVLLFNMPFVSLGRPAIGVSLLKSRLTEEGVGCEVGYANLTFAQRFGIHAYRLIDEKIGLTHFVGDWLFGQWLFGTTPDREAYLEGLRRRLDSLDDFNCIVALEPSIESFLDHCIEYFDVASRQIIGFSTTFQQNLASLALAKRIKDHFPEKLIVFGGANCEAQMGKALIESFPFIDAIFDGESDYSFPLFVLAHLNGVSPEGIGGVHVRRGEQIVSHPPGRLLHEMDALPDPDFEDYFRELSGSPFAAILKPTLPIETSRGCWWGAKQHCTFCGLNGGSMAFRSKSPDRVLAELERMQRRWAIDQFVAVDNIMDHRYFGNLLPRLREARLGVRIFYEIKANLRRDQVKLLSEAGVTIVQPGIESLSTHVLSLMRKGVTAAQNVQLLKWCKEYGVEVAWNLLYGFPGETEDDYIQTGEWIKALEHLRPPHAVGRIRLDRFSPYFNKPENWGMKRVRPSSIYRCLYGLEEDRLADIAYFFEFDYPEGGDPVPFSVQAREKASCWQKRAACELSADFDGDNRLVLTDTRVSPAVRFELSGVQRDIYLACDEARRREALEPLARSAFGEDEQCSVWLDRYLEELIERRLMIRERDRYLSLAVARDATKMEDALQRLNRSLDAFAIVA
jgi:ribosomal peptide maturation radical SAM protein 1